MKKFIFLFILGITTSLLLHGQCDIRMYDIYTPKGSPVVTFLMCESSLARRLSLDSHYTQTYPNATQIKTHTEQGYQISSTRKFNCHGYAWLRVEQGIDRWIGTGWASDIIDPERIYITDGSYIEVSQETYPGKVFWDSGDHTAVTTSEQGIFISKWNEYPLMQHAWNYSPYGTNNLKYYITTYSISGPSQICDQATYTVNNLPQGATVQWSVNTTNLTVISQGNNSITYGKRAGNYQNEYDVRITAKITLPDGNNVYLYSDVVLWNTEIDEDREYMQVEGLLYKSGGIISLIYPMEGITDYEWVINTKDWVVLNASESRVELGGGHFLGYFTLTYKFKGPCDNEYREITQTFYVCENPPVCYWEIEGAFLFTLYPNPATSIVTIELQESARGETTKTQRNSGIFKSKEYEVQLWSTSQLLRTYRTSDEKFQLSVNGLPAGIYFVRVIKDGKAYTEKLIKK